MFRLSSLLPCLIAGCGISAMAEKPDRARPPIKVLWLGGGETSHQPASMRDMLVPILEKAGLVVSYRSNESVLNPDSLKLFNVVFIYNAKKGRSADGTPDLTTAQEDALYNWVGAGNAVVGYHSANSSYLENPRYRDLFGASFTSHGDGEGWKHISLSAPAHPAVKGTLAPNLAANPKYWDEGRVHRFTRRDTLVLLRARDAGVDKPWAWVRPEGKGWAYYNSSGHDERAWSDENFQTQLLQALKWGASVAQPTTGGIRIPRAGAAFSAGMGPVRRFDALGAALGGSGRAQRSAGSTIVLRVGPGIGISLNPGREE